MSWSVKSNAEADAIRRLSSGDDHTAAIIAATIVEARLEDALKTKFQRDAAIEKEMFRTSGPLGSFSAKIKLAFLIGLISKEAYNDLDIFKDIRNRFAHWVDVESFKSSNIKSLTDRLRLIEKHFEETKEPTFKNVHKVDLIFNMPNLAETLLDPRWRYLMTAMLFGTAFMFPHGDKPLPR